MIKVRLAQFIVLVVLCLCCVPCHAKDRYCQPSSCGDIPNISYPFRLLDDPPECGDIRYNLSCENNLTVLHLYPARYFVLAINYENATIRVVDANVHKGNCSSLPPYSLSSYNFSHHVDPHANWRNAYCPEETIAIMFLTCEARPDNTSSLYVDTAPCINATSGHSFVVVTEGLYASELLDSCNIELQVLSSADWYGTKDVKRSYIDIHNELLYGNC
ncbi:LEAF RUST 10 DISEASE-RESISTANCE LOCUS RECEPTOR-LIKE PROTEIN KINASE-like 1.2 [Argentina anserina]|uniref:LEAF RUST 10 DISEASE-RESISTANCE LOCUS RECEPTOR-LIKE PROTEIN KINASE-like 1.2 n=1 Tax=Argentina anserina TaxID=57926 RepID=UPI0021762F20|nr:LEAF RUST 10 DISEASE-RESISTANCE LOCUS RECEPTOR-LIKE PROTEIN KINASE-like 1.2 [Potentilla anserina]